MPNFTEIETFVDGRTYARMYGHTYGQTNGHLRPALLGRLCRRVDLKGRDRWTDARSKNYAFC